MAAEWSGEVTTPWTRTSPRAASTRTSLRAASRPSAMAARSSGEAPAAVAMAARPPERSVNPTSGRASATRTTASLAWPDSAGADFMNFRRAGVLKKRSRTSTVVPRARATSSTASTRPPSSAMRVPTTAPAGPSRQVSMRIRQTDAMAGMASPRKPMVAMEARPPTSRSLEVAWRSRESSASSRPIPDPSSVTRTRVSPPSSRSTWIDRAPASRAFSSNSFTTDAGRSTTSPAAIWFTSPGGSTWMRVTHPSYHADPTV